MVTIDMYPALEVLLLVTGAFTLPLIYKLFGRKASLIYTLLYSLLALILSIQSFLRIYNSNEIIAYPIGGWSPPVGIVYVVDKFSGLLGILVSTIMLLIIIYSFNYIRPNDREYLYYTLLLTVEAGMLGCIYSGDAFHLFVMLEVTSLSAYALVAYMRDRKTALRASFKYAIYGGLATTIYFLSIVFLYGSLGTLTIGDVYLKLSNIMISGDHRLLWGAIVFAFLSLIAFMYKAAVFPLHFWLPDAHSEAPSSVSALLSGLVVNIGVYGFARFTYTIFHGLPDKELYNAILLFMGLAGALSALIGSLMMLVQKDVKRIIAYSTVMNMGYIVMGYSLGTLAGIIASTYHMITHSIAKSLAFMSCGSLINKIGSRKVDDLIGVGRVYKKAGIPFAISLLTLAGVPPLGVFISEYLLVGSIIKSEAWLYLAFFIASYISSTIVYLRLLYDICIKPFHGERKLTAEDKETSILLVLIILSILCIITGLLSGLVLNKLIMPSSKDLWYYYNYIKTIKEILINI